ncbi:MAG: N-6 DNA methylase [Ruminococcus sp.]|nr:N-6 DNA methylase [Ruminococcus sp.]
MSKQATKNMLSKINDILEISDSYQAPEKMMNILKNKNQRRDIFFKFLELFDYDLSYEWFFEYFQEEHADRKNKKQDFTPKSISLLMSELLDVKKTNAGYSIIHEPAAGTGSTVIAHWYKSMRNCRFIWNFSPDDHLYILTELSDKTIPFLLFNLMIRGINAIVIHGNSLQKNAKDVFWIFNEKNNAMGFSDLYTCPHSKHIENLLDIKFL